MNLWNGVYPNGYPNVPTPAIGTNGTAPVGDYAKIKLSNSSKEIILAAQFINDPVVNVQTANGTNIGNRVHEYFIMQYDSGIPGLSRDQFNGRPSEGWALQIIRLTFLIVGTIHVSIRVSGQLITQ